MNLKPFLLATSVIAVVAGGITYFNVTASTGPANREEIEAIVKEVITKNPELLIESVQNYQMKLQQDEQAQAAESVVKYQADLEDPNSPTIGNPKGDVTVVEFFDYHCGYCKKMLPTMTQLIQSDKDVRVVFKEFPILSEDSQLAATSALAVWRINKDKYFPYHTALMSSNGRFDIATLKATAKSVGVDPDAMEKEMKHADIAKEIEKNHTMANAIGISGTPAIVIGTQLLPGAVDFPTLKERVATARANKKS